MTLLSNSKLTCSSELDILQLTGTPTYLGGMITRCSAYMVLQWTVRLKTDT